MSDKRTKKKTTKNNIKASKNKKIVMLKIDNGNCICITPKLL